MNALNMASVQRCCLVSQALLGPERPDKLAIHETHDYAAVQLAFGNAFRSSNYAASPWTYVFHICSTSSGLSLLDLETWRFAQHRYNVGKADFPRFQ